MLRKKKMEEGLKRLVQIVKAINDLGKIEQEIEEEMEIVQRALD